MVISELTDGLPRKHPNPDGDVILNIGEAEEQRSIRVASKVMSLVSPVFKTTFAWKSRNGGTPSTEHPMEIDLPDDDVNAMVWLCHGLHWVNLSTETAIPIDLVGDIAILVDKYDCAEALSAWSQIWLKQWSGFDKETTSYWVSDGHRYWDLLRMAFVFNDHDAFYWFSLFLIYIAKPEWCQDSNLSALAGLEVGRLPDFVGAINARRNAAFKHIVDGLEDIVYPALYMSNQTCRDGKGDPIYNESCRRSAKTEHYFHFLVQRGIWPRSRLHHTGNSISDCANQLRDFENWRFHGEERPKKHRFYDKSKCRCVRGDWKKDIEALVSVGNWEDGLCLACVKRDKVHGMDYKDHNNSICQVRARIFGKHAYAIELWDYEGTSAVGGRLDGCEPKHCKY